MIGDILWPIAFAYAAHRLSAAIEAFKPVRASEVSKSEQLDYDIPNDLVALANQENEVWAQEEVLRVIREKFEMLQDWNQVRAAMGIGRID